MGNLEKTLSVDRNEIYIRWQQQKIDEIAVWSLEEDRRYVQLKVEKGEDGKGDLITRALFKRYIVILR